MASRPCTVQLRYRVDPVDRTELLSLLEAVRAHAVDLGVADFSVWQDQDDPWSWTELHHFDSWSHHQRLAQKSLPPAMVQVYAALAELQVGGEDGVESKMWSPVLDLDGALDVDS